MKTTTILENKHLDRAKQNYFLFLTTEKYLAEMNFKWLRFKIKDKLLHGEGILKVKGRTYPVEIFYSPFFYNRGLRMDRIYVRDTTITYNDKIHVYRDLSLCLYHPVIDRPWFGFIPLFKMIPWISEWCIHYEEFKKYGVWLGKEIAH